MIFKSIRNLIFSDVDIIVTEEGTFRDVDLSDSFANMFDYCEVIGIRSVNNKVIISLRKTATKIVNDVGAVIDNLIESSCSYTAKGKL